MKNRSRRTHQRKTPLRPRLAGVHIISFWATVAVLCCGAMAFVSASRRSAPGVNANAGTTTRTELSSVRESGPAADQTQYVRRGRLLSRLQETLRTLGDRVEKPGKERVVLNGTLNRSIDSKVVTGPARIVWELPGRIRIEEQDSDGAHITGFNGRDSWKSGGSFNIHDQDLIETFAYDSVEHFLIGQSQGVATRFLGDYFRLDGGDDENYAGPLYDIYQTWEGLTIGRETRKRVKHYCINSKSKALEIVQYEKVEQGLKVRVEVRISDWRSANGQLLPGSITRFENNIEVLRLTVTSTAIAPGRSDGIFDRP